MDIIFDAYKNSDLVGKLIVDILLIGSAIIWSIIIMKVFQCFAVRRHCKQIMLKMSALGTAQHKILGELERDQELEGPLASLGRAASKALLEVLKPTPQDRYALMSNGNLPRALSNEEIDRIQVAMESENNVQQRDLEQRLPIMGIIITLAPMLGLFGTVWGVMATFIGIVNNGGRPDIQAIAPGISGALLTTVGGLAVSIPAIFVNNFVVSAIQNTDQDMEDFQSFLLTSLQLARTMAKSSVPTAANAPAAMEFDAPAVVQQPPRQNAYQPAPAQQSAQQSAYRQPQQGAYQQPMPQQNAYQQPVPQQNAYRQPQQSAYQQPSQTYLNGGANYQTPPQQTTFSISNGNPPRNP